MSNLSDYIARKLFEIGDEPDNWKCRRIEFRVSQSDKAKREDERDAGGLILSSMSHVLQQIIEQYAIERGD